VQICENNWIRRIAADKRADKRSVKELRVMEWFMKIPVISSPPVARMGD